MSPPPVLLTIGQFYGTLAAARCLGRAGVPVILAEGDRSAPACWSRHVSRRVDCPPVSDTDAFLARLLELGEASPGQVLLPSSDEVAWLLADHHEELSRWYRMLPVSFAAVDALLDKEKLHAHCQAVGISVPETRFPRSEREALTLALEVGFPLILKPRTQILLTSHSKGALVTKLDELIPRLREFFVWNHYGQAILKREPDVGYPMLQAYSPTAQDGIYGFSGYVDGRGEIIGVRAARKILQRPRKLGIGLCFEEAPIDEEALSLLRALCRRVGYRGVFEVELIDEGSKRALIDFNPRFYSQMAFDIDRGLPLPRFCYADALGDEASLSALAGEAAAPAAGKPRVYCHRFLFEVMLRGQGLSGKLSPEEVQRWRRWWDEHHAEATDAVADPDDPAPRVADVALHLSAMARHPRSFVRTMILDR